MCSALIYTMQIMIGDLQAVLLKTFRYQRIPFSIKDNRYWILMFWYIWVVWLFSICFLAKTLDYFPAYVGFLKVDVACLKIGFSPCNKRKTFSLTDMKLILLIGLIIAWRHLDTFQPDSYRIPFCQHALLFKPSELSSIVNCSKNLPHENKS